MNELTVVIYKQPDAILFKRPQEGALHARVCGDCGFTEFYLDDAQELYKAYQASVTGHEG